MRPKHNDSVAGWYPAVHVSSVRLSHFLVPLDPRQCVPSTTIQSLTGILESARVCFQFRCYLFWHSITHARASQAQRLSRWLVFSSARFLFLSSVFTFSGALPLVFYAVTRQYFLLSTLLNSRPTD